MQYRRSSLILRINIEKISTLYLFYLKASDDTTSSSSSDREGVSSLSILNLGSSVTKATPGKPSSLVSSTSDSSETNTRDLVITACSFLLGAGARVLYTVVTPSLTRVLELGGAEEVTELPGTWAMMKPSWAGRLTELFTELGGSTDDEVETNLQRMEI